jgi:hypothetical protein
MSGTAQIFPVVGSGVTFPNPMPTQDAADGTPGTAAPSLAIQVAGTDGTNLRAILTDTSGKAKVDLFGNAGATLDAAPGAAAPTNAVQIGGTDGTDIRAIATDTTGRVKVIGSLTNNNAAPAATEVGVLPAVANAAAPTWTEGDQVLESVDLAGNQRVVLNAETTKVIGTVNQGTSPWVSKDAADMSGTVPGTAPSSTTIVGEIYNSAAPVPTAGQTLPIQSDAYGNTFIRTSRRSLTVAQATTIASSTAVTTVLAAQAANVFADITDLIITVTPQSVTGVAGTATLSDGTNNYVFDIVDATVSGTVTALVMNLTTPLAAATAATAWTIALSNGTMTVHIVVNAILQKVS